mmetsp:Transcript_5338/g.12750  ORF Transcript_5338/g.12750 Transcript_5338/m.12750 type:complete len:150 (-) Transcript_5338:47-496(-)
MAAFAEASATPPLQASHLSASSSCGQLSRNRTLVQKGAAASSSKGNRLRLRDEPPPAAPKRILSNDTAALPMLLPERHAPGGKMRVRGARGEVVPWMDLWQPPKEITHGSLRRQPPPGSLSLRCPGKVPRWLVEGKDFEEDETGDVPPR